MTKSPKMSIAYANKIVGMRNEDRTPTKWDTKSIGNSDLNLPDLRYKVAISVVDFGHSIRETAKKFGVSPGFVHYWKTRYEACLTLKENRKPCKIKNVFKSLSNRPKYVESKVRDSIRFDVKKHRIKYPFLGSTKIKKMGKINAACATIDKVLKEENLLVPGKKRKRNKTYGRFERSHSLDMVQIDYKKWKNGISSIFVFDDSSRTILGVKVSERQSAKDVVDLLDETFKFWKIKPKQILSDHGTEFYSVRGGKGRSLLDQYCAENGIQHITGRVRHPQTQGKIERCHSSCINEIESFGPIDTIEEMKDTMGRWVEFYNTERPHQSLNNDTPINAFFERLSSENFNLFLG